MSGTDYDTTTCYIFNSLGPISKIHGAKYVKLSKDLCVEEKFLNICGYLKQVKHL